MEENGPIEARRDGLVEGPRPDYATRKELGWAKSRY